MAEGNRAGQAPLAGLPGLPALRALREPAAIVLVLAVVLKLLVGVVSLFWLGRTAGVGVEAADAALLVASPVLCLALAAAVVGCVLGQPSPRARTLAAFAGMAMTVSVLASLGLGVAGLVHPRAGRDLLVLSLLGWLAELAVCALSALVAVRVFSSLPAPLPGMIADRDKNEAALGRSGGRREPGSAPSELPVGPPADLPSDPPAVAPTWRPDEASGAVWHSAGEAASGASAASWGTSDTSGWSAAAPDASSEAAQEDGSRLSTGAPAPGWQVQPEPPADASRDPRA